jgi:ABC-type multidrug transport system fused ATPase/permease subunit
MLFAIFPSMPPSSRLRPLYRLGIPALALGQGLSEIGFVLAARAGLQHGDSLPLLATLILCVLLRFVFQDRGAALEARALRDTVSALRGDLLDTLRTRAAPAYRPDIRRKLDRALEEHVPRAAEGMLARRHFEGALLQCLLFAALLLIFSWKTALLGLAFGALVWPVLRWRNRSLKALEAAGMTGRGDAKNAREDFGDSLESLDALGLGESLLRLDEKLAAAQEPESRWRRAQLRYPALLETGLFFVLAALLLAGSFTLPDWNALLLFSLLLLLAYRPVREAARHYPASLAGAAALRTVESLRREWEQWPAREDPETHPDGGSFALRGVHFGYEPGKSIFSGLTTEFAADGVTGITGPNGAGKTTLLRLLSGAETPLSGKILWTPEAREHGIACLPQRAYPGRDWADWAQTLRTGQPWRWKALDALLRLDRLVEKSAHPEALSGGERQRMTLARVLCSDAAFLLLDEPTTALPGDEREDILRGALEFWRQSHPTPRGGAGRRGAEEKAHRGALVVSHEPYLERLCDTVVRIEGSESTIGTAVTL